MAPLSNMDVKAHIGYLGSKAVSAPEGERSQTVINTQHETTFSLQKHQLTIPLSIKMVNQFRAKEITCVKGALKTCYRPPSSRGGMAAQFIWRKEDL